MASALKPGWSKPSTILFATEIPANEKAFAFALAQAVEFGAQADPLSRLRHAGGGRVGDLGNPLLRLRRRRADRGRASGTAGQARPGCRRSMRNGCAPRAGRRTGDCLFARARATTECRSHRHGDSLPRPHRQAPGRLGGRGRTAHRQCAGLHHRSGGG